MNKLKMIVVKILIKKAVRRKKNGCILFILHNSDLERVQGPELSIYTGTSLCTLSFR